MVTIAFPLIPGIETRRRPGLAEHLSRETHAYARIAFRNQGKNIVHARSTSV
jgi:hypothetical protein